MTAMTGLFERLRTGPGDGSDTAAIELDRRSVLPATLAALGEAAVIFLPLKALAVDAVAATGGPLLVYPVFVLLFAGSVAVATGLRRYPGVPSVAAAIAVVLGITQGLVWGSRSLFAMTAAVVLGLLLALRVVMLALRDWRDPIRMAFGAGVAALLVEVLIGTGGTTGWRPQLPLLITQFFLGALASRAASVRLAIPRPQPAEAAGKGAALDPAEPRRWLATTVVLVAGLGVLLGTAFVMGRQGGVLQLAGEAVFRAVAWIVGLGAFALAKLLLRPLNWVVTSLHLSLAPLSRVAENLEGFRARGPRPGQLAHASALNRFLGLLFFVLMGVLLVRALRRRRELAERYRPSDLHDPEAVATPFAMARALRRRARARSELPADTVRRWYAQALLALHRLGLPKPPAETPDEYLRGVRATLPGCAAEFTVLTRAYEDVRYGNRTLDEREIERLEPHRLLLMQTLRRAEPARKEEG
jgi:hypothetical protein